MSFFETHCSSSNTNTRVGVNFKAVSTLILHMSIHLVSFQTFNRCWRLTVRISVGGSFPLYFRHLAPDWGNSTRWWLSQSPEAPHSWIIASRPISTQNRNSNRVRNLISGKRGKAQRDGRSPLFYRHQTFVATCKNFVTMATGVGWGPVWIISLYCRTLKPPLWNKNWALNSYTSWFIANFMSK